MNRGGAELRTIEVMRHLASERFVMHYASLSGAAGDLDDEIFELGGTVHLLPLYHLDFPSSFIQLLRQQQYNVVQSHVHHPSGFLLWLAAWAGVPVRITNFRSSDDGRGNTLPRRTRRSLLKFLIYRYSTHILAVSAAAMAGAWRADWQSDPRCQVIYNGIDLNDFKDLEEPDIIRQELQIDSEADIYIHVGRLEQAKNHQRLVAIFTEIVKRHEDSYLLLVGRGDNAIEMLLRESITNTALEKRIIFAGLRSDVPRLLNAADFMIFPSLYEGLPGAVLEASAAGVPVLASNLPVIREIATFLPGIKSMPLDETNEVWAREAITLLLAHKQNRYGKETLRQQFATSPFTIASCASAYKQIWLNG